MGIANDRVVTETEKQLACALGKQLSSTAKKLAG